MAVLVWLGVLVLVAALMGVWRARAHGPRARRRALLILVVALVAVGIAWRIVHVS